MKAIKIMPLKQNGCASLMSNVDANKVEIPIAPSFVTKCCKVESCQRLIKNKKCDESTCPSHNKHGHNNIDKKNIFGMESAMTMFPKSIDELFLEEAQKYF